MRAKQIFGIVLMVMALFSCTDDNHFGPGRQEGYLYFHVAEGHSWADGKVTRAGVEAPIRMDCSLNGQPIYLHTEVSPTMSKELEEGLGTIVPADSTETPQTRGIRYTGDVFSLSSAGQGTNPSNLPKINNIGVYATRDNDRGVIFNYARIEPDETEAYSGANYNYLWNVKDEEIADVWDSGTADFYGFAPHFNPTSNSNGLRLSANAETGVPTLTYEAPTDVINQLDILTAKHLNVPKGEDVELEFTHVTSAIKFRFAYGKKTSDGGSTWTTRDDFVWSDGTYQTDGTTLKTYSITVSNIQIQGVYKKGSWTVGDDPYNGGAWDVDESAGKETYSYAAEKALSGATTGTINSDVNTQTAVDLNPDADGYVFMMVPQTMPSGAQLVMTCTLVNTEAGQSADTKTMTLTVPLAGKMWAPGYTYYYTISLSDFAYVFDYNTATAKTYSNVPYAGVEEKEVFIRSYKVDSKGTKTNVNWDIEYYEVDADATGVGGNHGGDVGSWKKGSNGWIHVYDSISGNYDTEVLTTHAGANEGDDDRHKYFKIAIGTIMSPIIDLSLWNQDQTKRWRGRSTSNCYIVAGPGTYRIPLIYGNAWTNGKKNERAYNSGKTASANILGAFINYSGNTIGSAFIKDDVGRSNVANACLVWEEGDGTGTTNTGGNGSNEGTVVKVNPVIDTAVTGEDEYNTDNATAGTLSGCDYLQFQIKPEDFKYGNAVVGIRDGSGNIIWSWHIWMVDAASFVDNNPTLNIDGNNITYATTNIGWVDGGRSIPAEARTGQARLVQAESGKKITIGATQQKRRAFTTYFTNVLYQWGRKDPMRGITATSQEGSDNGAPRGADGVQAWYNIFVDHPTLGGKISVQDAIKNPNKIYGVPRGDLYETVYYNLWASTLSKVYNTNGGTWIFYGKTIYDPSPVGYCVPPSKCLTKLTRNKFAEISSGVTLPIICNYTDGSTTVKFHASGCRTTSAGKDLHASGYHDPASTDAANGFFHTATPYSNDENWQLRVYFYSGYDTHNFIRGDMCEALSVKPVLWNGEVVETVDVDQHEEYLTFTFLETGAFYWQDSHSATTSRTISYSTDKGQTWNTVTSSYSSSGTKITDVSPNTVVWIKGTNDYYCKVVGGVYYYQHFHSTANYQVSGNIMSLIYGDDFKNKTSFPAESSYNLCSLFYDPEGVGNKNEELEDVDGLVLPATTLTESCYESMFQNCTLLVSGPELPATDGATNCYKNMYKGCSNLNTVKVMLTSPSSSYTDTWLDGVSSNGTFFYSEGASWTANSTSGIPNGWSSVPVD